MIDTIKHRSLTTKNEPDAIIMHLARQADAAFCLSVSIRCNRGNEVTIRKYWLGSVKTCSTLLLRLPSLKVTG